MQKVTSLRTIIGTLAFFTLPCHAKCKFKVATATLTKSSSRKIPNLKSNAVDIWNVTILSDSEVEITDKKTSKACKAEIDQVTNRYWADGETLVFESGNAVQSYLTFVRGKDCETLKSVDLPINDQKRKKLNASLQICHD
jgi:hypothetical protein